MNVYFGDKAEANWSDTRCAANGASGAGTLVNQDGDRLPIPAQYSRDAGAEPCPHQLIIYDT